MSFLCLFSLLFLVPSAFSASCTNYLTNSFWNPYWYPSSTLTDPLEVEDAKICVALSFESCCTEDIFDDFYNYLATKGDSLESNINSLNQASLSVWYSFTEARPDILTFYTNFYNFYLELEDQSSYSAFFSVAPSDLYEYFDNLESYVQNFTDAANSCLESLIQFEIGIMCLACTPNADDYFSLVEDGKVKTLSMLVDSANYDEISEECQPWINTINSIDIFFTFLQLELIYGSKNPTEEYLDEILEYKNGDLNMNNWERPCSQNSFACSDLRFSWITVTGLNEDKVFPPGEYFTETQAVEPDFTFTIETSLEFSNEGSIYDPISVGSLEDTSIWQVSHQWLKGNSLKPICSAIFALYSLHFL